MQTTYSLNLFRRAQKGLGIEIHRHRPLHNINRNTGVNSSSHGQYLPHHDILSISFFFQRESTQEVLVTFTYSNIENSIQLAMDNSTLASDQDLNPRCTRCGKEKHKREFVKKKKGERVPLGELGDNVLHGVKLFGLCQECRDKRNGQGRKS